MEIESSVPVATPENTPLPGGGSWHWDDALGGWVENVPGLVAAPAPMAGAQTVEHYPE